MRITNGRVLGVDLGSEQLVMLLTLSRFVLDEGPCIIHVTIERLDGIGNTIFL